MIFSNTNPTEIETLWNWLIGIIVFLICGFLYFITKKIYNKIKKMVFADDLRDLAVKQYNLLNVITSYSDVKLETKASMFLENYRHCRKFNKWKYASKFHPILLTIANGLVNTTPDTRESAKILVKEFQQIEDLKKGR